VGDVGLVLRALTDGWSGPAPARDEWFEQARSLAAFGRASWDHQIDSWSGSRLHAGAVAREVAAFARETGPHTLVADGGDALTWALAYAHVDAPGRLLHTTTALGSLGVGLPFANAAAAARADEPVFCFIGDGSFGLCAMEFDTAVRHRLPVITIVSNNWGWRDVSHEQDIWFGEGRRVASDLGDSNYERLAEVFGGHGELVEDMDELRPALKRALDAGVPSIINARTDPGVLSELLRNMGTLNLM
jgi:acetolactate synthase-1/2/3 large subunit